MHKVCCLAVIERWPYSQPNRSAHVHIPSINWTFNLEADGFCKVSYTLSCDAHTGIGVSVRTPLSINMAERLIVFLPKEEIDLVIFAMELSQ